MANAPRKYGRPRYLPSTAAHRPQAGFAPGANGPQSGTLPGLGTDNGADDGAPFELTATLDKVIFHNDENGYSVLSLLPKGKLDAIVGVGHMILPEPGCLLKLTGRWTTHPRFGRQFAWTAFQVERPSSLEGIAAFLSSGLIKGIGKTLARRIVDKFGENTLFVLDEEAYRLSEVKGISAGLAGRVEEAWKAQHGIRELIVFLEPNGISTAYAVRIYKFYGAESLEVLKENPYRLAMDIRGIGFLTADMLAGKLGFEKDHPLRAEAGVLYTLRRLMEDGHMCYPRRELVHAAVEDLDIPEFEAESAVGRLIQEERFVEEIIEDGSGSDKGHTGAADSGAGLDAGADPEPGQVWVAEEFYDEFSGYDDIPEIDINDDAGADNPEPDATAPGTGAGASESCTGSRPYIYLSQFHHYETSIAHYLGRIMASPKSVEINDAAKVTEDVLAKLPITLAPRQEEAVHASAAEKVLVITGGPGTGKTTIINAIIKVFAERTSRILLAAPTGRAAKRLAETSNRDARTIHRLLEYNPTEDGFARNEDQPLACGLLIIDEVSMMDTMLMYHLLKAVPLGCTVILVGDMNQLPSVGPGNVLKDVILSGVVPVVELNEIFRQAEESEIILNAHRINRGQLPELNRPPRGELSDFYFISQEDPEKVAELIVELVRDHIPRRFGFDPTLDIQVLSPMHKGTAGAANLNVLLQAALNRETACVQRGERRFLLGDKVMQTRNNYEKDVYNGDIGRICYLNMEERELTVRYDDRNVLYAFDELDDILPAYAISVHKSQGSEYRAVVLPILTQHYVLLQRNLLYTAVTRGRDLVIIVGTAKALSMAVKNNHTQRRYTWLAWRLKTALGGARVTARGSGRQRGGETIRS